MIKIIGHGIKVVVKTYAAAQDYAEQNRIAPGEYCLWPSAASTIAAFRTLVVGYIKVDGKDEPWTEIKR